MQRGACEYPTAEGAFGWVPRAERGWSRLVPATLSSPGVSDVRLAVPLIVLSHILGTFSFFRSGKGMCIYFHSYKINNREVILRM